MDANVLIMAGGTGGHVPGAGLRARVPGAWLQDPLAGHTARHRKRAGAAGRPDAAPDQRDRVAWQGPIVAAQRTADVAEKPDAGAQGGSPGETGLRGRLWRLCHRPRRSGCEAGWRAADHPRTECRRRDCQPQPGIVRQPRVRSVPEHVPGLGQASVPPATRYASSCFWKLRVRRWPVARHVCWCWAAAWARSRSTNYCPRRWLSCPRTSCPKCFTSRARIIDAVTAERYRNAGVEAQVAPFIQNMAQAYSWADLVVLIPLPHAIDDHQSRNADYLAREGAAFVMPQATTGAARWPHA